LLLLLLLWGVVVGVVMVGLTPPTMVLVSRPLMGLRWVGHSLLLLGQRLVL
jgi:hypothetical protein